MGTDDWYSSSTWSEEDQEIFSAKIKRARYRRWGYMVTKGEALLRSADASLFPVGEGLIREAIEGNPDKFFLAGYYETLGAFYARAGRKDDAIEHFRTAIASRTPQFGTRLTELDLATELLSRQRPGDIEEAGEVLASQPCQDILMNVDRFRWEFLMATLKLLQGRAAEAVDHAEQALAIAGISSPQFPRHPTVGVVNAPADWLEALRNIISEAESVSVGKALTHADWIPKRRS